MAIARVVRTLVKKERLPVKFAVLESVVNDTAYVRRMPSSCRRMAEGRQETMVCGLPARQRPVGCGPDMIVPNRTVISFLEQ